MMATLIQKRRIGLSDASFAEGSSGRPHNRCRASTYAFKYYQAQIVSEVCVPRNDNETGKSNHEHPGEREVPYAFTTLDQLVEEFWADAART